MTPQRIGDRPATSPVAATRARKPWRKKTPLETFMQQADQLRQDIAAREQELKTMRQTLQKFEEARKIFETS